MRKGRGKTFKIGILIVLAALLIYGIYHRKLVNYGLSQLKGQVRILTKTVAVEDALADSVLSTEQKHKLRWVREVVKYAGDSLQLNTGDNYQTFYNSKGKPVLWVVNACEPFALEKYKWNFPFLGKLGYKGFFEADKAKKERDALRKKGFDTDISEVTAWSTLGFFSDPVLSEMLKRDSAALAELIIHELTHTTFYISGNADLNENVATFIGRRGAEKFLVHRGLHTLHRRYIASLRDKDRVKAYLKKGAVRLDSAYSAFETMTDLGSDQKEKVKREMINEIILGLNELPLHSPKNLTRERASEFNNTFFTGYLMYNSMQDSLMREYEERFHFDLNVFIKHFEEM